MLTQTETNVVAAAAKANVENTGIITHLNVADKNNMDEPPIKKEEIWKMMADLLPPQNLVSAHQIDSYNHFIQHQFEKTFKMFNPICIRSEKDFDLETHLYSLEIYVSFDNMRMHRPQIYENNGSTKILFPQEARTRNCTYGSQITMDVHVEYVARHGEKLDQVKTYRKMFPRYNICNNMPIMVLSDVCELKQYKHLDMGECDKDVGGYFIIKGSEKVVLGQERSAENIVQCHHLPNSTKYSIKAVIKCTPPHKLISPKQIVAFVSKTDGSILIEIPRIKQPIPVFILFRALGVISDLDICRHILLGSNSDAGPENKKESKLLSELQSSVLAATEQLDQDAAFQYLMTFAAFTYYVPSFIENKDKIKRMRTEVGALQKEQFVRTLLENDLFAHCPTLIQKRYFLGYMVNKLLCTKLGWTAVGDRDSYVNKRIDTTGFLLNKLLVNQVNKIKKNIIKAGIKEIDGGVWKSTNDFTSIINSTNIENIINSTIEAKFIRALSTGDFSITYNASDNKVGVAQVLNRLTHIAYTSHLRRVSRSIDKNGKLVEPRKLHCTSWGYFCPYETPEGASVGIVNNMSVMTHFTMQTDYQTLYKTIAPYVILLEDLSFDMFCQAGKVFLNGMFLGISKEDPIHTVKELKKLKHRGIINIFTSIYYDYANMEICIGSDAGRCTRPLFRVKNNRLLFTRGILADILKGETTWNDLFLCSKYGNSVMEYLDPLEQNGAVIASSVTDLCRVGDNNTGSLQYTHCEIDPSLILGMTASCVPFPEHNQSPRIVYQCAQAKQAISVYMSNFYNRLDKTAYVLNYPTKPLVDTQIMNILKFNETSSGCNITVAIMSYSGYNQEDSILMNQGSIDRGMFQSTIYHSEKDEDKMQNEVSEVRGMPDIAKTEKIKTGDYTKINASGFIPKDQLVNDRDVIMAKVSVLKENTATAAAAGQGQPCKYTDKSILLKTCGEEVYIDKNVLEVNGDGYQVAKVKTRATRKPIIGDKFSSRHGQKGTVGCIIAEKDMPFTASGARPDIIINPHAIPSRMTIGQLLECTLGKVLVEMGLFGDGTCFNDSVTVDWISQKLLGLGYEAHGNELMYSGETGQQLECSVFMGPTYYQRLKHMVSDKQHARATGPPVALTRQPSEGRSRGGGLRVGEMERDCEIGNTQISLTNGLSVKIGEMQDCGWEVLGWDSELQQCVPAKQTHFMDKGERECVQLTFQDGRTKICTPEHPILTSENTWTKAKDLVPNETRVNASVTCPLLELDKEIKECDGWSLTFGKITLTTDTKENYLRTIAFMRILGYLITDGSLYYKDNDISGTIYLGHMIDVKSMLDDLEYFYEYKQKQYVCKNLYYIRLPSQFARDIIQLPGMLTGARVNQPGTWPAFILQETCPRPLVREFLGGVFGGDGHTCVLGMHRGKRDILTSVEFSQSKHMQHVDSLHAMMVQLQDMLKKCGIHKTTIQKAKETTCSRKIKGKIRSYQTNLHLELSELIPFAENIGFRYCCHKSQRLEAGVAYRRLRNTVERQHNWLVKHVDESIGYTESKKNHPTKKLNTKQAILNAVKELEKTEALVHKYAIPTTHDMVDHCVKGTKFGKFASKSFPTAEEFIQEIGALSWFNNNEDDLLKKKQMMDEMQEKEKNELKEDNELNEIEGTNATQCTNSSTAYGVHRGCEGLPAMDLKLIDIRSAGVHPVFDITVDRVHSFVANGIVAHNCIAAHGAATFMRERLYESSDKYAVHVCNECGLIAAYNDVKHVHLCNTCENRTNFSRVEIPYACKLLFQELAGMNVIPRVITTEFLAK